MSRLRLELDRSEMRRLHGYGVHGRHGDGVSRCWPPGTGWRVGSVACVCVQWWQHNNNTRSVHSKHNQISTRESIGSEHVCVCASLLWCWCQFVACSIAHTMRSHGTAACVRADVCRGAARRIVLGVCARFVRVHLHISRVCAGERAKLDYVKHD